MITEYMRNEKVAAYVVLVAKDGSRFVPVEQDCKVTYDDTIFDLIAESDGATALAKVDLHSEVGTREKESKSEAQASLGRVATVQAAKP
jgi:hypothetical protein